MFLHEAMGIKRFIELTTKKFIDKKKMESSHQIVQIVLTDEETGGYRVKAQQF